jgi:hypothetical protein
MKDFFPFFFLQYIIKDNSCIKKIDERVPYIVEGRVQDIISITPEYSLIIFGVLYCRDESKEFSTSTVAAVCSVRRRLDETVIITEPSRWPKGGVIHPHGMT